MICLDLSKAMFKDGCFPGCREVRFVDGETIMALSTKCIEVENCTITTYTDDEESVGIRDITAELEGVIIESSVHFENALQILKKVSYLQQRCTL